MLITFGFLYWHFDQLKEEQDATVRIAVLESLERRWLNSDQDIFIAAVILNPLYCCAPFSLLPRFTKIGIQTFLGRVWRRLYQKTGDDPLPAGFLKEIGDYLNDSGVYCSKKDVIQSIRDDDVRYNFRSYRTCTNDFAQPDGKFDPLAYYRGASHKDRPKTAFQDLAFRIFSICANSASCERLFSMFGNILTKLCNRLRPEVVQALAELKLHIRNEEIQLATARKRFKKHVIDESTKDISTVAAESSSQDNGEPSPAEPNETAPGEGETRSRGFRSIARGLEELVNSEAELDAELSPQPGSEAKIPLHELFAFDDPWWVKSHEQIGMRGLDEELEFYELIDMDAAGEPDLDVDLDDMAVETMQQ